MNGASAAHSPRQRPASMAGRLSFGGHVMSRRFFFDVALRHGVEFAAALASMAGVPGGKLAAWLRQLDSPGARSRAA